MPSQNGIPAFGTNVLIRRNRASAEIAIHVASRWGGLTYYRFGLAGRDYEKRGTKVPREIMSRRQWETFTNRFWVKPPTFSRRRTPRSRASNCERTERALALVYARSAHVVSGITNGSRFQEYSSPTKRHESACSSLCQCSVVSPTQDSPRQCMRYLHARFARGPALTRGFLHFRIDARLRGVRSRLKSGASTQTPPVMRRHREASHPNTTGAISSECGEYGNCGWKFLVFDKSWFHNGDHEP